MISHPARPASATANDVKKQGGRKGAATRVEFCIRHEVTRHGQNGWTRGAPARGGREGRLCVDWYFGGHWALQGGVGTVSAVNADSYDCGWSAHSQIYHAKTRRERQEELIRYAIDGGVTQVKAARENRGRPGDDQRQFPLGDGRGRAGD